MRTENDALTNAIIARLEQLTLQQRELVAEIRAINGGRNPSPPDTPNARVPPTSTFEVGDVVRIRNGRRSIPLDDRIATVTRVTEERVYFLTTGGIRTWRAPGNLTLVRRPTQHVDGGARP